MMGSRAIREHRAWVAFQTADKAWVVACYNRAEHPSAEAEAEYRGTLLARGKAEDAWRALVESLYS